MVGLLAPPAAEYTAGEAVARQTLGSVEGGESRSSGRGGLGGSEGRHDERWGSSSDGREAVRSGRGGGSIGGERGEDRD